MPRSFVVRGELLPTADASYCRRLLTTKREDDGTVIDATIRMRGRHYAALYIDGFDAGDDWLDRIEDTVGMIADRLPGQFRDVAKVCQITSSALIKPGVRVRLWYILDRPIDDDALRRWLADAPVDPSLFRAV